MPIALAAAVALVAFPARAATRDVNVRNFRFEPTAQRAEAGDQVTWHFLEGTHTVTAWQGAAFDSGPRAAGTYTWDGFSGGTVRYLCTIHGSVVGDACSGMCGLLTDEPVDTTPPQVAMTSPEDGSIVIAPVEPERLPMRRLTLRGTASDGVAVSSVTIELTNAFGSTMEFGATSTGTPAFATWEASRDVPPGRYRARARAEDPTGNVATTAHVSFSLV